jgi:hypothetical protein
MQRNRTKARQTHRFRRKRAAEFTRESPPRFACFRVPASQRDFPNLRTTAKAWHPAAEREPC